MIERPLNKTDEKFMRMALRQARKGLGRTTPNPAVGAVVVREGKVIASGYHKRAGVNHAEVDALYKIGGKGKKGDVLYVTLEPCNHQGRTPPCTEAILKSGIKRVVVGMKDPNPKVSGGGSEFLREKGVEVTTGVLEAACRHLNEFFIKYISTGRPFVVAKSALTLDGWTATTTGDSWWITNEKSRQFVHRLRDRVDGVMVGVGTVLADDPSLTTRLRNRKGRDPVRIIVDTHLRTPDNAKVLNNDSPAMTLMAVGDGVSPERLKGIKKENVSTLVCPIKDGGIDLVALMDDLVKKSITSLLVEGGATLMGSMIRERLIDKYYFFQAPKILGGNDGIPMASGPGPERIRECLNLRDIRTRKFGSDVMIRGYPDY
jgi:diaminohydroxyphosphoribosylaminopyrimidine deaminase/5-amino-6-(5-phosphoribosylamino)uracil reductase